MISNEKLNELCHQMASANILLPTGYSIHIKAQQQEVIEFLREVRLYMQGQAPKYEVMGFNKTQVNILGYNIIIESHG